MPWRFHEIPSSNANCTLQTVSQLAFSSFVETSSIRPIQSYSLLIGCHLHWPARCTRPSTFVGLSTRISCASERWQNDKWSQRHVLAQHSESQQWRCLKRKARTATATSHWSWQDLWRAGYAMVGTVSLDCGHLICFHHETRLHVSCHLISASANRSCLTTRNWNLQESSSEIAPPSHWKQSTWNIAQEKTRSSCERHQDFYHFVFQPGARMSAISHHDHRVGGYCHSDISLKILQVLVQTICQYN